MEYEVNQEENGTRVRIFSEERVAVAIRGDEERIYLPETDAEPKAYYVEDYQGLTKKENGWELFHPEEVSEVEVFSKN